MYQTLHLCASGAPRPLVGRCVCLQVPIRVSICAYVCLYVCLSVCARVLHMCACVPMCAYVCVYMRLRVPVFSCVPRKRT